jgi:hypothetical protein
MRALRTVLTLAAIACLLSPGGRARADARPDTAVHAQRPDRLLVRNVMVIYGTGKPPYGPMDVLVESGRIAQVRAARGDRALSADAVIDATGKYVMPGIVNTHMHWHDEREPAPAADPVRAQPLPRGRRDHHPRARRRLREVQALAGRERGQRHRRAAHAGVLDGVLRGNGTADEIRANVREAKARGADGLKVFGDGPRPARGAAGRGEGAGLKTTTHIAVEETTARTSSSSASLHRALLRHRRRGARRRAGLSRRHEQQQRVHRFATPASSTPRPIPSGCGR